MPKKTHESFSLFKKQTPSGRVWYVKLWDSSARRYNSIKSTGIPVEGKRERRREAEEAARNLFDEFAVIKSKTINNKTVADTPLVQYLENFWTPDSEYTKYKRDVKNKPLTPYYIQMNYDDVRHHVQPFPGFSGVTVGSLNKAILKQWMIWLARRKAIRRKKDGLIEGDKLSGRRANAVLQSVRVAIRWAVDNEEIPIDPFRKLGEVSETIHEKGVLTFEERKK
ncbi:MAG: hypothetical protein LBU85_08695 [Treponema sp.]|jgi:hypothetical protein|nr:hypothetical protein [Treponema sp.]